MQERITITINPASAYESRVRDAIGQLPHGYKKKFFFDCVMRTIAPAHLSADEIAARIHRIVDERDVGFLTAQDHEPAIKEQSVSELAVDAESDRPQRVRTRILGIPNS